MASVIDLTINDSGFLQLPSGTTAQRPVTPTVTASVGGPIVPSSEGQQLFIPGIWQRYQNLPDYLLGLLTTTTINDSDAFTISFSHPVRVYLIRNVSWNAVDTTGWTTVETGRNYITNMGNNISVFRRDFAAGNYTFDNNSAMYMFDFPGNGTTTFRGHIRYNTDTQETEYFNGNWWVSSYGRTAASAATSAQALFNLGVRTSGVYFIRPPGEATARRHFCDFSEGLGWMMVWKHTGGIPTNPFDSWVSTGTNIDDEANMNRNDSGVYTSPFVATRWSTIAANQARVEVLDDGCLRNFITFNSAGTNNLDWFRQARIVSSSFSGITGGTYNIFSIEGDVGNQRRWFISRAYGGCNVDFGYLVAKGPAAACPWDTNNFYHILSDERSPGRAITWDSANVGTFNDRRGAMCVFVR
jgi:hypothetical protein